jgi:hypothetical protein
MGGAAEGIECRCYTLPHRHPLMLGKLPGFRLPFMVTVTQFGLFSVGAPLLFFSRGLWGVLVGRAGPPELVVIVGLPALAAWALRFARMEGRSPLAMALGLVSFAFVRASGMARTQAVARRRHERCGPVCALAGPAEGSHGKGRPVRAPSPPSCAPARACSVCPGIGRGWG